MFSFPEHSTPYLRHFLHTIKLQICCRLHCVTMWLGTADTVLYVNLGIVLNIVHLMQTLIQEFSRGEGGVPILSKKNPP